MMFDDLIETLREWPRVAASYEGSIDQLLDRAADAIEVLARQLPRWVPVSERLPNKGQKVLIYWREAGEPVIDTAFWQGEWAALHWVNVGDKVTHWMPLPTPPQEKQEDQDDV